MRSDEKGGPVSGFLEGQGQSGLVSAIVPAFNRAALIADALNSLAAQPYRPLQIVVVDDGSTDGTWDAVARWGRDNPAIELDLVQQSNRGVAAARNAGLLRARGEFIFFLDSDDVVKHEALPTLVETLECAHHRPFALGHVINTDMDGVEIPGDYSGMTQIVERDILRNHWLLFAALYRRETVRKAGPFNETLIMGEDTEFNWRVILECGVGERIEMATGMRRHHTWGHLYIDSDATERMLRSIEMHEALANLIDARPQHRNDVTWYGLCAINNFYHRLGRTAPDDLWERLAVLLGRLSVSNRQLKPLLLWFARPANRRTFRIGYRMYRFPRNMAGRARDIWRSATAERAEDRPTANASPLR